MCTITNSTNSDAVATPRPVYIARITAALARGGLVDRHEAQRQDRAEDRDRADHQRVEEHRAALGEGEARDQHRGDRGDRVGLEEVGGHAGAQSPTSLLMLSSVITAGLRGYRPRNVRLDLAARDRRPRRRPSVKMPPPRRANTEIERASPKREADERLELRSGRELREVVGNAAACPRRARARKGPRTNQPSGRSQAPPLKARSKAEAEALLRRLGDAHVGLHRDAHAAHACRRRRWRVRSDGEAARPSNRRKPTMSRTSGDRQRRPSRRCGPGDSGRQRRTSAMAPEISRALASVAGADRTPMYSTIA